METKVSVEFSGDTAVMLYPRGDSTMTSKSAVPRGTFPFLLAYGLMEHMGRWARATGKDSVRFTVLASANETSSGYIRKRGGDTLVFMLDEGQLAGEGPFTFRLDRQGHLTSLTGKGSTLQIEVQRVASVPMAQATQSFANRPLGSLSPRDTARATVGGAEVSIDYSRPSRRGRDIFGALEPFNKVWRTGANAATQFTTPVDLVIAGAAVPAGKYTLWTLPTATGCGWCGSCPAGKGSCADLPHRSRRCGHVLSGRQDGYAWSSSGGSPLISISAVSSLPGA